MRVVLTLAGVEARRFAQHPLFLAGLLIGMVIGAVAWRGGNSDFEMQGILAGQPVLPLAAATLMVGQLIASRARRDRVGGGDDAYPVATEQRVAALLLAGLVAPAAALLLMAPIWLGLLGLDLTRSIDGVAWRPDLLELLQAPTLLLGMAWLGIGVGRFHHWTPFAVLFALTLTWSPLTWVNPMIAIDPAVGDPSRDVLASTGWQVAFLLGLAAIGAALARARTRMMWVAVPATVTATAAAGIARF